MAARFLLALSLGVILALAIPEPAFAGELRLTFQNGRVTLLARDVPLPQILAEWERVGGTRIVNRDGVPGSLVTLDLVDVPEARALATLLRPVAGYLATARVVPSEAASQFARIVIMPGAASPAVASLARDGAQPTMTPLTRDGAQPAMTSPPAGLGRPQIERRVMPDGRVLSFVTNPDRPVEPSVADDEQDAQPPSADPPVMMRMPGQLPQLVPPGQPPGSPQSQAAANPTQADPSRVQNSGNQQPPTTGTAPSVVGTATTPGTVIPGPPATPPPYSPPPYVPQTLPPSPPKPPGI